MKKILIIMTVLLLSSINLYAVKDSLTHTNPMPNLVRYVVANAELIQLTKDQKHSIKSWADANKPKVKALVRKIVLEEKNLLVESLTSDKNVLQRAENILNARRDIIKIKTLCRAHLKAVLSNEQYSQIVAIYINEQYKKNQIII